MDNAIKLAREVELTSKCQLCGDTVVIGTVQMSPEEHDFGIMVVCKKKHNLAQD